MFWYGNTISVGNETFTEEHVLFGILKQNVWLINSNLSVFREQQVHVSRRHMVLKNLCDDTTENEVHEAA